MRRSLNFIIVIILLVFVGSNSPAEMGQWWSEEGVEPFALTADSPIYSSFPGGLVIDWQRKVAISTGRAALTGPMTVENREQLKKIAENDALERLAALIGLVRFDGFTRLSDITDQALTLQNNIPKLIKKSNRITHEKVRENSGILEITVEFNLNGKSGLSGTLFPSYLTTLPPPPSSENYSSSTGEGCTGLIIDASNLGIEGGLAPNIVSEDGTNIYSLKKGLDKSKLIIKGFVDYALSGSHSTNEVSRAGENPLTISAKSKLKSPYNCDIVISDEDAAKVVDADRSSGFLKKLNVVILL
jgi:hypothetical protein